MRDPYQVLGVPSTATDEEVKKAYRALAGQYQRARGRHDPGAVRAGGGGAERARATVALVTAQSDPAAEWNFRKGAGCDRRGWRAEARQYYQTAVQMDPDNAEYQRALDMAEGRGGYRPNGYSTMTTTSCGNADCLRLCGATLCCNALGVPVCFC